MKQKNLVLIAVAVGCGLVAAVLTSQMGAKPAQVEQVQVPVAAKDLSVGTKLSKDELKKLVTYKKFNRDALPASFTATEEELADKRIVRTIRAGEPFNPKDLTNNTAINPPPGMNMMTFQMSPDKGVAGFAGPGSKVDVIATITTRKNNKTRAYVLPLLTDMLVLAINAETQYPQAGQAFSNMSMVSLAVTNKQAQLLHAAINRGADLRLVLLNTEEPAVRDSKWTEEEIWKVLADQTDHKGGAGGDSTDDEKKPEVVKLPVPTEDLPAGTELTPDVIDSKFKMVDFTPPAPGNIVQNLREHQGKFLQNKLAANQFVPRSFLADSLAKAPPAEKSSPKSAPKNLEVRTKPPVYWDATIQTSSGMRRFRYQKLDDGEFKFLGEVSGGTVRPAPIPNQVKPNHAPEGKPSEGKKSDGPVI
jgi:Flp pilus assembly protein CpaB